MKGKLSLGVERRPDGKGILRVEGSIDAASFKQFEAAFRELDGLRHLVVDMPLLTYISSSGLSLLIKEKTERAAKNGDLVLVRPPPPILDILQIMGLMTLFRLASSVEEALNPDSR